MSQLEARAVPRRARTTDVSGDGTKQFGRDVTLARDEVLAKASPFQRPGVILSDSPLAVEPRAHQSAGRARCLLPQ